jgi:hypothetical protein
MLSRMRITALVWLSLWTQTLGINTDECSLDDSHAQSSIDMFHAYAKWHNEVDAHAFSNNVGFMNFTPLIMGTAGYQERYFGL